MYRRVLRRYSIGRLMHAKRIEGEIEWGAAGISELVRGRNLGKKKRGRAGNVVT